MKSHPDTELRVPALRIRQGDGQHVYSFAVDGKRLRSFAAVSRVKRSSEAEMTGYQRPEAVRHIQEIKRYLESESPLMPNAVVAFDERVHFEPLQGQDIDVDDGIHGTLVIPLHEGEPDAAKPGWLVDGQQRTATLRDARIGKFPVYVTAFVAKDEKQQRSQFILVNATKPLPKGLIHELLPSTGADLPIPLLRKRLPAYLVEQLNFRPGGPLNGKILRRPSLMARSRTIPSCGCLSAASRTDVCTATGIRTLGGETPMQCSKSSTRIGRQWLACFQRLGVCLLASLVWYMGWGSLASAR